MSSGGHLLNGGQAKVASSLKDLFDKGSWNKAGCFSGGLAMYLRRTISVLQAEATPKDPKLAGTSERKILLIREVGAWAQ